MRSGPIKSSCGPHRKQVKNLHPFGTNHAFWYILKKRKNPEKMENEGMFMTLPPPPPQKPITVWVHGTRPSSILPFLAVNKKLQEAVDSVSQAPKGLRSAYSLDQASKTYQLLQALSTCDPEQFPLESLYTFGWSGNLDVQLRKQAAQELYDALCKLTIAAVAAHGKAPPITLIAHSHGGNVILHMTELHEMPFHITRTILLACPVQNETAHLVNHSFLGTVYSLHSHVDMVQILDPQRLHPYKQALEQWQKTKSLNPLRQAYFLGLAHPFCSERHCPPCPHVIQANVCWKTIMDWQEKNPNNSNRFELFLHQIISPIIKQKRGLLHTEFINPLFFKQLPTILEKLDTHTQQNGFSNTDVEITI